MGKRLVGVVVVILLAGFVGVPPMAPARARAEDVVSLAPAEQHLVDLVNSERAKAGLGSLAVSAPLTTYARHFAAYMASANFFSHVGPDGSNITSAAASIGYGDYTFLAENLAAGQPTPEGVLAAWLGSDSHRQNVLAPPAKEVGVGLASGGSYGIYWVMEFGARPQTFAATALTPASRADDRGPSWTSSVTGHTVSGAWLAFVQANGGIDNLGQPRSEVVADPLLGGRTVQYFQRLVLEFHPENPPSARIQRRLLGDLLYPGADAPASPDDAPPGPSHYFPFSPDRPTGLGHFVADYARSGQAIYFAQYFDSHGGVDAFGYPKEEPKLHDGQWTQRFQAALFEYHPENDRDGLVPGTDIPYRNYRVQLRLLGDEYIAGAGLPFR